MDGLASSGQGFVGCNMFAYCQNRVVISADFDGNKAVVVIYDNNSEEYGKDNTFMSQIASWMESQYTDNGDQVFLLPVISMDEFVSVWNSLSNTLIDTLILIIHGSPGHLGINDSIMAQEGYDYTYTMLNEINIRESILLLSCHGGTYREGGSVAYNLANRANTQVRAAANSKIYFFVFGDFAFYSINPIRGRWVCSMPSYLPERGMNRSVVA